MSLCDHCNAINIEKLTSYAMCTHHRTFRELKRSAESCPLCALFVAGLEIPGWQFDYDTAYKAGDYRGMWYQGVLTSGTDSHNMVQSKDNDQMSLIGLSMTCQGSFSKLDVYASEESAAATQGVSGRPIRPVEDFGAAKRWLNHCFDNHSQCVPEEQKSQISSRKDGWLPTRVIDVGPIDGSREPRLLCDPGYSGQYITLSHCWGSTVTLQTTTKTLQSHEKEISMKKLTKTFRDAVLITRSLGFAYLWIDSLCIIQDDPKDWETESSRMADVYGRSTLTIAASSSKNSSIGCFFPREPIPSIALNYPSESPLARSIYIRKPLPIFQDAVNQGPLNRRAWTFQERWLSRRILHYCQDQLHWECEEICLSEDGQRVLPDDYFKSKSILHPKKNPVSHQLEHRPVYLDWYEMVHNYTQRDLTKAADKLPALSGLAGVFARLTGDRYLAGLWESDLAIGMLWQASRSERPRLQRPPEYRAPSWSWAALDGQVEFNFDVAYTSQGLPLDEMELALTDIDVALELAGSDPYGKVASGTMSVTGRLKEVEYQIQSESLEYYNSPLPSMRDPLYNKGKEIGSACFDEAGTHGTLYCLEVSTARVRNDAKTTRGQYALILKSIGDNEKYRRVGTGFLRPPFQSPKTNDWFYDVPKKRVTIF